MDNFSFLDSHRKKSKAENEHDAELPFLVKSSQHFKPRMEKVTQRQEASNPRLGAEPYPKVTQAVLQEYLIENYGIRTLNKQQDIQCSQLLPSSLRKIAGEHINKMINAAREKKEDIELKGVLMMLRQFAFAKYFSRRKSENKAYSSIPPERPIQNDMNIQRIPIQRTIKKTENLGKLIRAKAIKPISFLRNESPSLEKLSPKFNNELKCNAPINCSPKFFEGNRINEGQEKLSNLFGIRNRQMVIGISPIKNSKDHLANCKQASQITPYALNISPNTNNEQNKKAKKYQNQRLNRNKTPDVNLWGSHSSLQKTRNGINEQKSVKIILNKEKAFLPELDNKIIPSKIDEEDEAKAKTVANANECEVNKKEKAINIINKKRAKPRKKKKKKKEDFTPPMRLERKSRPVFIVPDYDYCVYLIYKSFFSLS